MVENEKDENIHAIKSTIGVLGDHVDVHGGIKIYQKGDNSPKFKTEPELEDEIRLYRKKAESMFDSIPVVGFATKLNVPIDIDDIYIPLRAMVNLKGIDDIECYPDSEEAHRRLAKCNAGLEIPLLDAFSEAEKRGWKGLVILGDPGSGKTTHMKRMLLWCLRKGPETMGLSENMLPVFLPLREITHLKKGFEDYIQDQFTHHFKRSPDFGRRLLEQDNMLFLFDGLDEVSSLELREQVSAWIKKALTDYPGCRFVVTCRFAGYSPSVRLGEKFLEMHIRPLSEIEAEKFVRKWYAIVEKRLAIDTEQADTIARQKSDDLINRLAQPDFRARRVFELTRNPLLLTNICLLHRKQQGKLPTRRVPLYDECIQVMLELWRDVPELKNMVSEKKGIMVLQAAALWLHQEENRTRAAVSDLAPVIEPVLKKQQCLEGDAHKFLRTIRDESGLLTGWDQDYYGFMHLNFQEYLAAREIRSRFLLEKYETGTSGQLKELAKHFGDSWWQEVALLLLAIEEKPSLFVPYMREVIRNPAFAQHADFLEMCLDDAFKPSLIPFLELLGLPAGKGQDLWDRQLTALRILMRQDEKVRKSILESFRDHPDERISQWIRHRLKFADQDMVRPEPSGYELVLVKGGTFMMGSDERDREKPGHKVTVPDFYMGRYPVINKEYGRFIAATGYQEPEYWGDRNYNQPWQPVVGVSWYDAKEFAKWAGLQLPSEAQWEYACRAESTTRYNTGDSEDDLSRAGWYSENSGDKLHPVGDKEPNAFGLYDMHGNVREWCEDHWHDNYKGAPSDGSAWIVSKVGSYGFLSYFIKPLFRILGKNPGDSAFRVVRGGSWRHDAERCRTAFRIRSLPVNRRTSHGFRLVRLPGQPGEPGR